MKKRLYGLKQSKIILWHTKDSKGKVIFDKKQAEFEPSEYYLEGWHIHRYTAKELAVLDC